MDRSSVVQELGTDEQWDMHMLIETSASQCSVELLFRQRKMGLGVEIHQ